MALKKSELYSSLWKSCDELRGGMDASQYKDYVLTILFLKYISDRAGDSLLDIPQGATFADIAHLKGDKEIGDKINKIIAQIADANDLRGVIDVADFNDTDKLGKGQAMVDRLSKLIGIFEDLDFGANTAVGDDLLGDAYEYLMRHFATESGKSKGQFYTPAEVSLILARILRINDVTDPATTVYDPTCGSGSLLLKAAHEAQSEMSVYGQEMDNATWALARMNMILHGYETAEIWHDNTLAAPHFLDGQKLKKFDYVVANPPFSVKSWTTGLDPANDLYERFQDFGTPPDKNGDYAFLLHIVKSLKATGRAAVILPHGVLFRGNKEADIRRKLVDRHLIAGIIGLPANVFYGTGIPACVIVLDKEDTATRKGIFMIDASRDFKKDGNKNRLRARDLHKIIDAFTEQKEIERYSRLVPFEEITNSDNDYNLNLPRYIDGAEPPDIQDLDAHLNGGIPERDIDALGAYWAVMPGLRDALFTTNRPGYLDLRVPAESVQQVITEHADYKAFVSQVDEAFAAWLAENRPVMEAFDQGSDPKQFIEQLGESLLAAFEPVPLIDAYAVYQGLMDYWAETMQDDAFLIAEHGWVATINGEPNEDLLPRELTAREFHQELVAQLDELASTEQGALAELDSLIEEHAGEEGLLAGACGDSDKPTPAGARARLKETKGDSDADDEASVLNQYLNLSEFIRGVRKASKQQQDAVDREVSITMVALDESRVRRVVVGKKWLPSTGLPIGSEVRTVYLVLTSEVSKLVARYFVPERILASNVDSAREKVMAHLAEMGFSWSK